MRAWVAAVLALGGVLELGCSGANDPTPWIDEGAAAVHCTSAGRTRMPPVLLDLPFPRAPTGLFARGLDPMALGDMGYERDQPVCAGMMPVDEAAIDAANFQIAVLRDVALATSEGAMRGVACVCDTADGLDVRDLVVECTTVPSRRCADSDKRDTQLRAWLAPLVQLIEMTPIPRRHWRLVGATDRPEWFVERIQQLLARHSGGSTVYVAGQAVPARQNHGLLRALLKQPGVVAVVRQDGGRGLLVARIIDGLQILDHFQLPAMKGPLSSLRSVFDNVRGEDVLRALEKPGQGYKPLLPWSEGNFAELDSAALERLDAMAIALSPLGEVGYDRSEEIREEPKGYVQRVAVQAPFGSDGRALRLKAQLTPAGGLWATAMADAPLGGDRSALGLSGETPRFQPAPEGAPEFVLRGTPTNTVLVHGIHATASVLDRVEAFAPGSVNGTTYEWDVVLPQGALAHGGAIVPAPGLKGIATEVMERDYRLKVKIDEKTGTITADIAP